MTNDEDTKALLACIQRWFEQPQTHLDDKSRRKILEQMVTMHIESVRRKEKARNHGKDILLLIAVVTAVASAAPQLLAWLGAAL